VPIWRYNNANKNNGTMAMTQTLWIPMSESSEKVRLPIYIDKELKAGLEKLAKRDRRSLSQMVVALIDKAVREAESEDNK
jgi:hypothetical protein